MSTIEAWFYSLPPFTKTYMVAAVASTLLAEIGLVSPYSYLLNWNRIISNFEIWRLVTPFVFFGGFSHMLLFSIALL